MVFNNQYYIDFILFLHGLASVCIIFGGSVYYEMVEALLKMLLLLFSMLLLLSSIMGLCLVRYSWNFV